MTAEVKCMKPYWQGPFRTIKKSGLITQIHDLKEPEQLVVSELFYPVAEREFLLCLVKRCKFVSFSKFSFSFIFVCEVSYKKNLFPYRSSLYYLGL